MRVDDIQINRQRKSDGATALIAACRVEALECVHALLTSPDVDTNYNDRSGETPLWIASSRGNIQCMKVLIKYGADLNYRDNSHGTTPLFEAVRIRKTSAVHVLLTANADVNLSREGDGTTPLMMAAHNGHIGIVKWLLNAGADVALSNKQNVSSLSCAAMEGHLDILKILHQAAVKVMDSQAFTDFVNTGDSEDGWTMLHFACMGGHKDVVKYLVEEIKVDLHVQDFENKTGLDHAKEDKHDSIVRWFTGYDLIHLSL